MYAQAEEKHPEQRTFSMALYIVTGFCGVMQCFTSTVILGFTLLVICFFMVKAQKATAYKTPYITHVEWTRRTLSIGAFFLFPIALGFALYFVWKSTDLVALKEQLDDGQGDIGNTITLMKAYVDSNKDKVERITTLSLLPVVLWWVRRCIYGFLKAKRSEPIFYPEGLL